MARTPAEPIEHSWPVSSRNIHSIMNRFIPFSRLPHCILAGAFAACVLDAAADGPPLQIARLANDLIIVGEGVPIPGPIKINYIEAYCRAGSTNQDWRTRTKVTHTSEVLSATPKAIRIRDTLADGVVLDHTITAGEGEIDFRVVAHNPTDKPSLVHWAQPCMRVDVFSGRGRQDMRALVPAYLWQSFLFIDGELTMMPTRPWAEEGLNVPGQVWVPAHVSRDDVNPRPLSPLVPSNGLTGCYSADGKWILATAWEPYQEVFQGVLACLHSDFRVGGLAPGETKHIRGKVYVVPADSDALVTRFEGDFPEQATGK